MSEEAQQRKKPKRFWRILRVYFRRFRIAIWIFALLLLVCLVYLNQVGLPGFIKGPLLAKLRERGVDLQFSRLRLRWYEGVVAENVRFGRSADLMTPELTLGEVQVSLNVKALTRARLQIDKLVLRHGELLWPVSITNGIARSLAVHNLHSDLRFLPGDEWALDNFRAEFAGADILVSGWVTNASASREWAFFHGQRTAAASGKRWQNRLEKLYDRLNQISFASKPELRLDIRGDARDLQSFSALLLINTQGANTPWGSFTESRFSARVFPADTNGTSRADVDLHSDSAQTEWASVQHLHLGMKLRTAETETNLVHAELELTAKGAQSKWASATNIHFGANWTHSITNPIPLDGAGNLKTEYVSSQWGTAKRLQLQTELATPGPQDLPPCDASWGPWTNIQPFALAWKANVVDFNSPKLNLDQVTCAGNWKAPALAVTNFEAQLYGARFSATAALDAVTRDVTVRVLNSNLDPHRIEPLMGEPGRRWLSQFDWDGPPTVAGSISVVLPAWTNLNSGWRSEALPTLKLAGEFNVPGGTHRGIHVDSAHSHVTFSNRIWHLPDLTLVVPDGRVVAEHRANEETKAFYWHLQSNVDLSRIRPLLEGGAQKGFDLLICSNPPVIDAEVWGELRKPETTGLRGTVNLTNFVFRGESFSSAEAALSFTNQTLVVLHPQALRGTEVAKAEGLFADFRRELLFLTNGFSTMAPMVVANAIGPQVIRALKPYQFEHPPVAYVHGTIPLRDEENADLFFDVSGSQFTWWRFHIPQVTAKLHWKGLELSIRDLDMSFYGGRATALADFKFPKGQPGTTFSFSLKATNSLLQGLMADLSSTSNHLEGTLSGDVTVTEANSESFGSVFGYGALNLRDGLIWDIPLFGIFTPVLNGVAPGLGSSRVGAGACSFTITNGVIRSEDLEMRAPTMRLQYRGTVDFDGHLKARVEAELLRDMWVVGPLVSTVLWPVTKMFEYKLTGTLSDPKTEPVYIIPKLMLLPFHPFRTLKSLLPPEPGNQNGPPPVFQTLPPEPGK